MKKRGARPPALPIDLEKIEDFIRSRYQGTGFSAAPSLPPTVFDTWCAVDSLRSLGLLRGEEKWIPSWLEGEMIARLLDGGTIDPANVPLALLWKLHQIRSWLRLPESTFAECFHGVTERPVHCWQDCYCLSRLTTLPGDAWPSVPRAVPWTCRDLYFYLRCDGWPCANEDPVTWLRNCQNPDGGFGFFPITTSYIENCDYCVNGLALLGSKPTSRLGASGFVSRCQTASGGLARNIKAAAFLDSTSHGLRALLALINDHGTENIQAEQRLR